MHIDTSKGNPAMDYRAHEKTYANFIAVTKFMVVFIVVLLAAMAYFLV
jgi:hypothetical protein